MDDDFVDHPKSGILFISFQNDIKIFEEMKRNLARRMSVTKVTEEPTPMNNYYGKHTHEKISFDTLTLGGGYYFVPPIPNKRISDIGEQFF